MVYPEAVERRVQEIERMVAGHHLARPVIDAGELGRLAWAA